MPNTRWPDHGDHFRIYRVRPPVPHVEPRYLMPPNEPKQFVNKDDPDETFELPAVTHLLHPPAAE